MEITERKYKGLHMESLEYESAWALGANCDSNEVKAIAAMIDRCNYYGLDTIETGDALAMSMEATQNGLIKDGLKWGDTEGIMELIRKIAFRDGIGGDSAEGMDLCSEKWGDKSIAMTVKDSRSPLMTLVASRGWASATLPVIGALVICEVIRLPPRLQDGFWEMNRALIP